jgi:hypothetical protein
MSQRRTSWANVQTREKAVCIYSDQPPKESQFSFVDPKNTTTSSAGPNLYSSITAGRSFNSKTTPEEPLLGRNTAVPNILALQLKSFTLDETFIAQASAILETDDVNISSLCATYSKTLHTWFPIISSTDLFARACRIAPDIQNTILFLSIYLHNDYTDPTSDGGSYLESVYGLVKGAWSHFQVSHGYTIPLIQAGLLIAMYEDGQLLEEESHSTIVTCANMGYSLGLHNSLRHDIAASSPEPALETHRLVWWGIIILERYKSYSHGLQQLLTLIIF